MTPSSPRVPKVPRAPRPMRPAGRGTDARVETSEPQAPPAAPETGDRGASVTVGKGAKVTLLNPERDRGEPKATEAAAPAEATTPTEGPRGFGFRRRRTSAPSGPAAAGAPATGTADVLAFPEPPVRRHRRRLALGAGIAVALVAALFAVLLFTPLVAARTITVQGTHLLPAAQVSSALDPIRGKPLAVVGTDDVRRLLAQFVQVKDVRVRAVPPDTLVVDVLERVPVALVKQDKKLLVVDGDGVTIGEASDTSQYPVPVIDGSAMPMGQSVFKAVTAVLSALPADVLAKLATASAQSVDSVQLKLSDGRTVLWGNADDRELKATVLSALMKAAENPAKGQTPPQVFDVSTPRHPVTH